jgi:hypothetical protein
VTGTILSVYRRRNARVLERLLNPALETGWQVALWALDEQDPSLSSYTHGRGPGTKFDLVNGLLAHTDQPGTVVVADDDFEFVRGDILSFAALANQAGLGLAQPAHVLRSNISHRITWRRPLSRARLTSFVEIGPVFVVSPSWRDAVLPFPNGIGMGWGLELDWMDLRPRGLRLGIVDATPIRHLSAVGSGYESNREWDLLMKRLEERGNPGWKGLRKTLETWRPWQRRAPWLRHG